MKTIKSILFSYLTLSVCLCTGGIAVLAETPQPESTSTVFEPRETGSIRASRNPDMVVEDFTSTVPKAKVNGKKGAFSSSIEPGYTPCGGKVLHVNLPATGTSGESNVTVDIPLAGEQLDWSDFGQLEFWLTYPKGGALDRGGEGGIGGYKISVTIKDGTGTGFSTGSRIRPYLGGVWQPFRLLYNKVRWSPHSKDLRQKPDFRAIKSVRLEISGHKIYEVDLSLACVGLKRVEETGPTVMIQARKAGFLTTPGANFSLQLVAERLPTGQTAKAVVDVRDYWGKTIFTHSELLSGKDGAQEKEISFRVASSGFYDISTELFVDGKPIWRATRGLACLPPLTIAQNNARRNSIFGIWPGKNWDILGASVTRFGLNPPVKTSDIGVQWQPPTRELPAYCWLVGGPDWTKMLVSTADEQCAAYAQGLEAAARLSAKGWSPYYSWFPYYGVVNEPNARYWGPMENLVAFHRLAYQAIKRGDPNAKVGGPGPYCIDVKYIEKFIEAGGDFVDFIDIHGYHGEEEFLNRLQELKAMLTRHGLGQKEIVISEKGDSIPYVTPEAQAHKLVRSYVIAMSEGVRLMIWHALWSDIDKPGDRPINNADADFNIVRSDYTANPAFVAYGIMTRTLLGATYVRAVEGLPENCRGYEFRKPDGTRILTLWKKLPGREVARMPLGEGKAAWQDIMGVAHPSVTGPDGFASIELTENPIYLSVK